MHHIPLRYSIIHVLVVVVVVVLIYLGRKCRLDGAVQPVRQGGSSHCDDDMYSIGLSAYAAGRAAKCSLLPGRFKCCACVCVCVYEQTKRRTHLSKHCIKAGTVLIIYTHMQTDILQRHRICCRTRERQRKRERECREKESKANK